MSAISALHRRVRDWGVPVGATGCAAIGAVVVSHTVFPLLSGDHDEAVYLTQADALAHGHLTLPLDRIDGFQPSLTGVAHSHLVFPFPSVWPAVLALARAAGSTRFALAAVAGFACLAVAGLARETLDEPAARHVGVALFVCSPLIWLLAGTYLPYVFNAGVVAATGALVVRGLRTAARGVLVLAGCFVGLGTALRPYDGLLTATVLAIYAVYVVASRRSATIGTRHVAWCAFGALLPVCVTLVVNQRVTGNAFHLPLQVTGGQNGWGFGTRRVESIGLPFRYEPYDAFFALKQNLWFFPTWLAGSWLVIGAAATTAWQRRRDGRVLLLAAMAAVWPLGYFFWWATKLTAPGARDGMGPHYYVPAVAPVVLLAAPTIVAVARRLRHTGVVAVGAALIAGTVVFLPGKLRDKSDVANRERAVVAVARTAPSGSIVMLDDSVRLGHPHPTLRTNYDLGAPVLFVTHLDPPGVARLHTRFPTRTLLRLVFDRGWRLEPLAP